MKRTLARWFNMNVARVGFDRRPFRSTPSLDLFVPLPSQEAVLASLREAFQNDDGIALLNGGPGSGKTLLALRFLESLGSDVTPIFIPAARFSKPSELHQAILYDLGDEHTNRSEHELRLSLHSQLMKALAAKKKLILVLDEAQHLSTELLEEVRLLDNWESRGSKALFALLVASPEVNLRLRHPELASLAQRVRTRPHVENLSREESRTFLREQLELCSKSPETVMDDEAIQLLAQHGRGIPRILNQLALSSLTLAGEAERETVDVEVVLEALARAGVEIEETPEAARPAYTAGAARSTSGESPEGSEQSEPKAGRSPKQKTRNRRAA